MKKIDISPEIYPQPTLYYDGVCNLCHFSVQWIIKRDQRKIFRYENLQSEAGQNIIKQISPSMLSSDSVILVMDGQIFLYSDASLAVLKKLGGIYTLLGRIGFLLPLSFRNTIYRFIAKNRYKWFGKKTDCILPQNEY
ncbi:MAG: thiol-disulfide oxidoreductase DCC family protein [Bacteroidota bacterium]